MQVIVTPEVKLSRLTYLMMKKFKLNTELDEAN